MKKKLSFISLCLLCISFLNAQSLERTLQDSKQAPFLSLEEAIAWARKAYPLSQNEQILTSALNLKLEKLYMTYIPHFKLQGTLSHQSEVPTLPINLPNYKALDKNQYKTTAELSQVILSGGNVWANKALDKAQTAVQKADVQNQLYKVQEAVINAYFNALLAEKQNAQNDVYLKDLHKNLKDKKIKVANGVALPSDVDKINIEILNTLKAKEQIFTQEQNAKTHLALLVGSDDFRVQMPDFASNLAFVNRCKAQSDQKNSFEKRPEMRYFSLKSEEADAKQKLEYAKSMPYLEAYIQGGYGNPGLNILKNEADTYYVAGLRLNWDFSNLYSSKQQHELVRKEKLLIASSKNEFVLELSIAAKKTLQNIASLQEQIAQNEKIIALQEHIVISSKHQNENGVLSTNDFISDINKLNSLKLEKNYQEIELLMQIYMLKQITNSYE